MAKYSRPFLGYLGKHLSWISKYLSARSNKSARDSVHWRKAERTKPSKLSGELAIFLTDRFTILKNRRYAKLFAPFGMPFLPLKAALIRRAGKVVADSSSRGISGVGGRRECPNMPSRRFRLLMKTLLWPV